MQIFRERSGFQIVQPENNNQQIASAQVLGQKKKRNYYDDNYDDNQLQINNQPQSTSKINIKVLMLVLFPFVLLLAFFGVGDGSGKHVHKKIQKIKVQFNPILDLKYRQENQTKIVITSSQKKYVPKVQYATKMEEINAALENKKYETDKRFKRTHLLNQTATQTQNLGISQIARKASAALHNPQYPQYMHQITTYQPYQDLPFCLFVKQSPQQKNKQFNIQIAKSIFMLNYTNFITIFYAAGQKNGLNQQQLDKLVEQTSHLTNISSRMYYKINNSQINYYGYKYLMHQLCVDKSFVMFVGNVLKNNTLITLNKYHQYFPVYLTFSQTPEFYLVNSFAMRLFDLVDLNDFNGTNSQYLQKPNSQAFFSCAIIQLTKKYTKKFPITDIYQPQVQMSTNKMLSAIYKKDSTAYKRQSYQYLIKLSQNFKIQNIEQSQQILKALKSGKQQFLPNKNTELIPMQMIDAIVTQQALFLPVQHSLNKRQYVQFDTKYGPAMRQQKSIPIILQQKQICVTFLAYNQSNKTTQAKNRILTSLQSIFKQNYTKFNVFLYDSGLQPQTLQSISQIIKQAKFTPGRYIYFKSKINKPIFHILKCAFTRCGANQLQVVIDSDFQIIGPNYFQLINFIHHYNPHNWVIHGNYKTDSLKFGTSYRIVKDQEYRDFDGKVKGLNFLAPLSAWEVKVIRSIPLEYHYNQEGTWREGYWHKTLMHSLSELSTVSHMQYIPEITFQASSQHLTRTYVYQNSTDPQLKHFLSLPVLKPLLSLSQKYREHEKRTIKELLKDEKN